MPPSITSPEARSARVWWLHAFGPWYRTVYGHRDEQEAARNAPAILNLLGLTPHARVLDLACGEGRYARALASRGFRLTGVDLSDELLEEARRRSPSVPGSPTYLRCDMRELPFRRQFDAVVCLFTSFGYFDERSDDAKVLEGVERALVPGGRLLLDLPNPEHVRTRLVAESEEHRGPYLLRLRRRLDDGAEGGPYVRKHVEIVDKRTGEAVFEVEERVRLYPAQAIDEALRAAGLEPHGEACGDFDGSPATESSPRRIRVAELPIRRAPR